MIGYYQPYWESAHSNELQHHGILGMKWGVRRFQNKDGTLTAAGKERYGSKNNKIEPVKIKGQSYDKDITFPAGTVGYRVSASPTINEKSPIYLSYDKKDHVTYFGLAISNPDYGIARDAYDDDTGKLKDVYSLELKAKEPIKAPSYQHAIDTFAEMVGDVGIDKVNPYDPKARAGQQFVDSFLKGYYDKPTWKNGKLEYKKVSEIRGEFAYKMFVDTLTAPSRSELYKEFTERLSKKGYNALVDPLDRPYRADPKEARDDYGYNFNAPFMILNPKKTLAVSKSTKLTESDKRYLGGYADAGMGINATDALLRDKPDSWLNRDPEKKKAHEKWKKWYNS